MVFTSVVQNGQVAVPPNVSVPGGTPVRVETLAPETPSLADSSSEFIGVFDDLPADLARNHDHYFHGTPKR